MNYKANSPENYIKQLPSERQAVITKLRELISKNLPKGFQEANELRHVRLGSATFNLP